MTFRTWLADEDTKLRLSTRHSITRPPVSYQGGSYCLCCIDHQCTVSCRAPMPTLPLDHSPRWLVLTSVQATSSRQRTRDAFVSSIGTWRRRGRCAVQHIAQSNSYDTATCNKKWTRSASIRHPAGPVDGVMVRWALHGCACLPLAVSSLMRSACTALSARRSSIRSLCM